MTHTQLDVIIGDDLPPYITAIYLAVLLLPFLAPLSSTSDCFISTLVSLLFSFTPETLLSLFISFCSLLLTLYSLFDPISFSPLSVILPLWSLLFNVLPILIS